MNVPEVWKNVSLFPKLIIVRVRHHLVPKLEAKAELFLERVAGVFHPTHGEVVLIAILRAVIKSFDIVVVRSGHGTRLAKAGEERKILRQKQRPIVMIVVAVEPIGHWRLWRDRFDRRMTVDARHRSVKARIRNSVNSDAAVVVSHILDQPINGVVGVGCFVDLISFLVRNVWPHVFINAFAHIAAAHIAVNEDVACAREQFVWPQQRFVIVRAIRTDAIRRAVEHDRISLLLVFRLVDANEEFHAIAHRNHHFALGVMTLDVVGELPLLGS